MKNTILLTLLLASSFVFSQQIHVRYLKILSSFTTTHEDLYIKDNQVLSIQDSAIVQNKLTGDWTMAVNLDNGRKPSKEYFVSDLNNDTEKHFFFTSSIDGRGFFIYDKVPKINWAIDEKQTKKIAGYNCYKATGVFRGTNITAYFTKELPYSAGPFKFYGLSGLILEIRPDNMDHEIWKAESVDTNDQNKIVYKPQFLNKDKISLKEYVAAKEERMNKMFAKVTNSIPSGMKAQVKNNQRFTVEQKYEWEDNEDN